MNKQMIKMRLHDIENLIADIYQMSRKKFQLTISHDNQWLLKRLLGERKCLMDSQFSLTKESFEAFRTINETLHDLTLKSQAKARKLYRTWWETEEVEWRNDCNVEIVISPDYWEDEEACGANGNQALMMRILEDIGDSQLYCSGFSGHPELRPEDCSVSDLYEGVWFSLGGPKPFGDFKMCQAFAHLLIDSMYSREDILKISSFWADVKIEHQRIVDPKGELL